MLLAAGYPDELIWAPSQLGTGTVDLLGPHTNDVHDIRVRRGDLVVVSGPSRRRPGPRPNQGVEGSVPTTTVVRSG